MLSSASYSYYVLGTRWLGHDDDFWSPVSHWVLPRLETVLRRVFGRGYATGEQQEERYAATIIAEPDADGYGNTGGNGDCD